MTTSAGNVIKLIQVQQTGTPSGVIWVQFDHPDVGQKTRQDNRQLYINGIQPTWTPIKPITTQFAVGRTRSGQVVRKQFPLRPAAAKTIHRSQEPTTPSQAQVAATPPPSGAKVPTTLPSTAQVSSVGPTSQDLELQGFIHTLSPIKKANNKSKTPYFDCLAQTSNASKVRAVCYETKKRTTMHQAYSSKTPVKISGVKRLPSTSFSDSLEEYKIAKMAKITPTMTEFDYNPDVASSIYSVQQALDGDVYKTIDMTAKVVNKENNKQPIVSKGKQLMKTECVIADHTNTIALTLWEDLIDAVDCGKTYKFKNVKIRSFNDIKYLTTNEGTTIHQDQDIHDINMDCEDISLSLNISEGKCISAKHEKRIILHCL
ncbi:unnamed protein product [Porites lobata]|uniref:Single-stranded DNA binding protein Ssb-like OB fold domain-containing protein n=1 Tax=Porites lobata TaxID=104759 RepID=A0ABN8PAC3_9CNID|nr:unnamed protein product [Porites lobata]